MYILRLRETFKRVGQSLNNNFFRIDKETKVVLAVTNNKCTL